METVAYLIKVNVAIIVLYGLYRLLLRNDTFFQWKRFVLLSIFLLSLLYPLGDIFKQVMENKLLSRVMEIKTIFPTYYLNEVVITAQTGQATSFSLMHYLPSSLAGIYCLVTAGLLIGVLLQMASIVCLIGKAQPAEIAGRKVYLKNGLETPFSFFGYIVLDSGRYCEEELREILRHEEAHVRQVHSFDTLWAELMCVVCWFNPFIWLMKKEIRTNLECLADRSVIDSGCDTEHYQFHLLRLSYSKAIAKITNNFNVSLLKKRIFMMNKKQTSPLGLAKCALFLPLAAALLLFNSFDLAGSRDTLQVPEEVSEPVATITQQDEPVVFEYVEIMPIFPGGESALMKYLSDNLTYPKIAVNKGIQGRVSLKFVVKADGTIDDVQVKRSLDPVCDEEAVRVVKAMPKWIPGKQKGKAVAVYYSLPIIFKLSNDEVKK